MAVSMSKQRRGDVTEMKVATELLSRGYAVSEPITDNEPYDLVVERGSTLHRIQVRTATNKEGFISFHTDTAVRGTDGEREHHSYTPEDIDAFIVYAPTLDEYYWIDVAEASSSKMRIRYDDSNIAHTAGVNWASEYRLGHRLNT